MMLWNVECCSSCYKDCDLDDTISCVSLLTSIRKRRKTNTSVVLLYIGPFECGEFSLHACTGIQGHHGMDIIARLLCQTAFLK